MGKTVNCLTVDRIYHAAIYVRLSKEDGDVASAAKAESNSISNQKNLIRDFLKDKDDIIVVSERVDDGYSGSNFERPGFQMMLEDIRRGEVDCVVVKDLSRFGREYIDSGKYIERLFPALGVRFIAVNDHIDSKEESGRDDIVVPFKNLMNDAYCRDISIKIRSHLEVKRKNGEYTGAFTPYGYKKDENDRSRIVPDLYAAGVVKDIFRMKLNGMSQAAIADCLNGKGILSPMEYKHSLGIRIQDHFKTHEQAGWSSVSVRRILENEVYVGTLVQGRHSTPNHKIKKIVDKPEGEWIRIEDSHEPVISKREFAIVQRLLGMDTRTSPNEDEVYVLSGLAVCADCGAPMIKRNVPAGGKVYSYYICSKNAATKECGTLTWQMQMRLRMRRKMCRKDGSPSPSLSARTVGGGLRRQAGEMPTGVGKLQLQALRNVRQSVWIRSGWKMQSYPAHALWQAWCRKRCPERKRNGQRQQPLRKKQGSWMQRKRDCHQENSGFMRIIVPIGLRRNSTAGSMKTQPAGFWK